MEDFNRSQAKLIHKLAELYARFFEQLQAAGVAGRQVQTTATIADGISELRTYEEKGTTIERYLALRRRYQIIREIHRIFEDALGEVEVGVTTSSGFVMTSKYVEGLMALWTEISIAYGEWSHGAAVAELIYEKHIRETDPVDSVDRLRVLRAEFHEDAIPLYKVILARALETANKELRREIKAWVERLKTEALAVPELDAWQSNNRVNTVQTLVQIPGWVPRSQPRSLEEVLADIGTYDPRAFSAPPTAPALPKRDHGGRKNKHRRGGAEGVVAVKRRLREAAKMLSSSERRVGFMVLYKITARPLVYDMSMLKEPMNAHLGVNPQIVERLQTIRALEKRGEDGILVVNDEHREGGRNVYYVLETLDGQSFRQLVGRKEYFKLEPDLSGVPSRRLGGYNCIVGQEVIAARGEPLILESQLERAEIDRDESYWRGIRIEILRIVDEIPLPALRSLEALKKELSKLGARVAEHIHFEIFKARIADFPPNLREYISRELRCSYVNELSGLQRGFARDLDLLWNRERAHIEAIPADAKNKLREAVRSLLDRVLEHHVNRRSNIYINIDNKFTVLMKALDAQ